MEVQTHKMSLFHYTWPIFIELLLQMLVGNVDQMMMSQVSQNAVAAIGNANQIVNVLIITFSVISLAMTILVTQYFGSGNRERVGETYSLALFVNFVFGLGISVALVFFNRPIFAWMHVPAQILDDCAIYITIIGLGMVLQALFMTYVAMFRTQGWMKQTMAVSAVMNVINIGGNAVLIYGFGMGVMGAALASLVSRAIACAAVLYLLQKPGCALRVDSLRAMAPNGGLIRRILRVGIPAGIENGMFQIGKLSVSSLTSTLGTAAIAANAVANTTTTFLNIPANAVGMAALTVVGQCLGAGEKEQAVYYSRRLMLTAYCGAWVMNLSAFFFANRFAVSLFNLSPEAQAMALDIMVWFNIVSLFVWPSSFTLPNILRAAGDARFTMTVSIVSMWAFRVGFCYLAVLCFGGGLLSIWMGMYLDWVFRSLCFYLRFRRGSWLEQSVI